MFKSLRDIWERHYPPYINVGTVMVSFGRQQDHSHVLYNFLENTKGLRRVQMEVSNFSAAEAVDTGFYLEYAARWQRHEINLAEIPGIMGDPRGFAALGYWQVFFKNTTYIVSGTAAPVEFRGYTHPTSGAREVCITSSRRPPVTDLPVFRRVVLPWLFREISPCDLERTWEEIEDAETQDDPENWWRHPRRRDDQGPEPF